MTFSEGFFSEELSEKGLKNQSDTGYINGG